MVKARDVGLFALAGLVALVGARGEQNRSGQIDRQQTTIRQLCDDVAITDGLVQAAITFARQPPKLPGADAFIREFTVYHLNLIDQLTNKDSACVKN